MSQIFSLKAQDYLEGVVALDWDPQAGWTTSSKEHGETRWSMGESLSESAYEHLLSLFGITDKIIYSIEKVQKMSPLELSKVIGQNPQSFTRGDSRYAQDVK